MTDLILASASPRRAEILRQLGVSFQIQPANIDESVVALERPHDYVQRIALGKAETVRAANDSEAVVLGADTAVVIDREVIGKPNSCAHAIEILGRLSGRWHEVYSAVALVRHEPSVIYVCTKVKFRPITMAEITAYWATGEPQDKAGAYAIQGLGGGLVERIEGSYSNVVGLPMVETIELLRQHGIAQIFGQTD